MNGAGRYLVLQNSLILPEPMHPYKSSMDNISVANTHAKGIVPTTKLKLKMKLV